MNDAASAYDFRITEDPPLFGVLMIFMAFAHGSNDVACVELLVVQIGGVFSAGSDVDTATAWSTELPASCLGRNLLDPEPRILGGGDSVVIASAGMPRINNIPSSGRAWRGLLNLVCGQGSLGMFRAPELAEQNRIDNPAFAAIARSARSFAILGCSGMAAPLQLLKFIYSQRSGPRTTICGDE